MSINCYGACLFLSFYTYDASTQHLTEVNAGGLSVLYGYSNNGDLATVAYTTGERRLFQYNEDSFLASLETYSSNKDLLSSLHLLYSWNGSVQMTIMPENTTINAYYGTSGVIHHVVTGDGTPIRQISQTTYGRKTVLSGHQVNK